MSDRLAVGLAPSQCSVLIPTRNRPERLETTLRELKRIGLGKLPLWVYDDASDDRDAVARVVAEGWLEGRVIRGDEQRGQAYGRNALMLACGTDFGITLDDDAYFLHLGRLAEVIRDHDSVSRRAITGFQCVAKATQDFVIPQTVTASRMPSFIGGWALFHIPSVMTVGGYRDFLVYGGEEPDLAIRLWAGGFEIWYEPSIVVEHNQWYSAEERRDYQEYDYLYARNTVLLATLNMPIWFGLPMGVASSLRRFFYPKRNYCVKLRGLADGIVMSFTHWRDRNPIALRQALAFHRFVRVWWRNTRMN